MAEMSFTEEVARDMLKEIQSWWEIPALAQYISLFREPFNLPEIEIEELEKGFVDDTCNGPSTWLQNLIIAFLNSILPSRINLENWEIHLRKLIRRKWPKDEPNPFDEDRSFRELTVRSKVVIVYSLCLFRLDRNDIAELMKSMDAEALRVQKLGVDSAGNTYWYFYGTRLYKEEPGKKKSWDEEWKQQKNNSFKKRGRGRPRKKTLPTSDGESEDFDTFDFNKKEGYMNVSSKSQWSVVCDTIEEWIDLTEKFKDSKSKEEISLFKIIQENFLPTLNKIYEEKEKKFQQKIRDLMPVREKIVTRRETRKMRGEDVDYSPANGYSSDEVQRHYPTKDRAQRLEERNKRASEAMDSLSHKKIKSNASTDESISSFDPESDGKPNDLQSQIEKLLTSVKLHKDSWPFLFPVDEEVAPGYYEIIKDPVDLSLIESRLYAGDYETVGNLDADFSKMVANCELYNGEFHPYSKMAQMLRIVFRKGVAKILESMQLSENSIDDSDGSSDSQYHSNSNSDSPPLEFPAMSPVVVVHKKSKEKKKRKNSSEALDLLAAASDIAVQDSFVSRTSPPSNKSPEPEPQQPAASTHVPLPSMPFTPASASHSNIPKPGPKPVSIPSNNFVQEPGKEKSVIVKNKPKQNIKRKPTENVVTPTSFKVASSTNTNNVVVQRNNVTPTSLNVASSTNTNNVVVQRNNVAPTSLNVASSTNTNNVVVQRNTNNAVSPNNVYQTFNSKAVPVVFSYNNATSSTESDLQFKSNSGAMATAQTIPNTLPVVQQVILPSGQQIQVQNGGQFLFASPQNSGGIFNKEQNVQFINAGPVNPGFGKMMPQFITSTPVLQVSKDMMPGLQFQTVSQNSNQAFTQVTASPQFINVPTYLLANQNAIAESPQQSGMNHYQLPQRQMHIAGHGIQ